MCFLLRIGRYIRFYEGLFLQFYFNFKVLEGGVDKLLKSANFFLAVILFYLLGKSLMYFVDLISILVGGGRLDYEHLLEIAWGMFSCFVVSVFLFMLIGSRDHIFYRRAFLCVLVYFVLEYLVRLHFLFSNRHIIVDSHLYWRTSLMTCIVLVPCALLAKLRKVILIYSRVKVFLSR